MLTMLLLLAIAQDAQPVVPPPAGPDAAVEKKICRSMVFTGSIMPKRTCMTRAQWAKMQASTDAAWESARAKRGFITKDRPVAD